MVLPGGVVVSQLEVLEPPIGVVSVLVADLPVGSSFREAGVSAEHVEHLVALGGSWPPIVVGRDNAVIDGAHRVAAARELGLARIEALVFDGGPEEAYIEFVRRNVSHGLLLTLRERKMAAVRVLRVRREWSDRRVAELCGISSKTVARLRVDPGVCPTGEIPQLDGGVRIGRDDRRRPVHRGSVRARVVEALHAQPSASLRAIAATVGVSPETVRLVRLNLASLPESAPTVAAVSTAPEEPASWRTDSALTSCEEGDDFLTWFERTSMLRGDLGRVSSVPLSRIYEIADEARRRSETWLQFAHSLEARASRDQ
jgi:ParB-like chromosome segregation protein Spo0J